MGTKAMAEYVDDSLSTSFLLGTNSVRRQVTASSRTVMVVDNDPRMLRYIRTILEDAQHDVITCDSGESALECFRNGARPRVVLSASSLPDMQSLELLPCIQKLHPRANVVLIAHTSQCGDLLPAIREGARDILLKPFLAEDLIDLLARLTPAENGRAQGSSTEVALGQSTFFVYASSCM